jgi:hypothetical protein
MNTPETLAKLLEDGIPMLTNAVKAVPEDKLDWNPADGSRTIRQVFTEAVMMVAYVAKALEERGVPPYEEISAEYAAKSIDELLNQLEQNKKEYIAAIGAFPEAEYETALEAPWGTWSYFQTMSYPYWNLMWHTGQINYIQTLYGDQNFY